MACCPAREHSVTLMSPKLCVCGKLFQILILLTHRSKSLLAHLAGRAAPAAQSHERYIQLPINKAAARRGTGPASKIGHELLSKALLYYSRSSLLTTSPNNSQRSPLNCLS